MKILPKFQNSVLIQSSFNGDKLTQDIFPLPEFDLLSLVSYQKEN